MATKEKVAENGAGAALLGTELPKIALAPLELVTAHVPIRGVTPVIPHKWSEKALRMMREAQSGSKVKPKHDPKVPLDEAEGACYYMDDGFTPGIPATAFKAALVGASRLFQGLTLVAAKQAFIITGQGLDQLIEVEDYERSIREDTPRNSNGSPDLRYRYQYWPWSVTVPVTYLKSQVDLPSVLALLNAAGLGGVGDWRPSAPKSLTGTFGRFEIDNSKEIELS